MKSIYVIGGGPSSGKTTLINTLKEKGHYCGTEAAREVIIEQRKEEKSASPSSNIVRFGQLVLQKKN